MAIPILPINVTISNITTNSATILWDQCPEANGYKVYDKDDNIIANLTGINETSYELTGLVAQTAYAFKVNAVNDEGQSEKVIILFSTLKYSNLYPLSQGNLVSSLEGMKVGDFIPCRYTAGSNVAGSFSELGTCTASEIPVSGTSTPDGKFHFVCVNEINGRILCIADRVIQTLSWDVINTAKLSEGKTGAITSVPTAIIRSLSGGNSFIDNSGNSTVTDTSLGSFPPINEYDQYIRLSDLNGKIIAGDNNVWHWSGVSSWCQETPILAIGASSLRVHRGGTSLVKMASIASSTVSSTIGFRPVLTF